MAADLIGLVTTMKMAIAWSARARPARTPPAKSAIMIVHARLILVAMGGFAAATTGFVAHPVAFRVD